METKATNRLAVMPVNKLMWRIGVPIILSMMLQAVYNIVDTIFVSNMAVNGEEAVNALTLACPIQMLIIAIAIGTGVGANALLSKSLGQGNREKANRVSGNALFLGIIIYLAFLLFGLFAVKAYIGTQTQNSLIFALGVRYLRICSCLSFGIVFFSLFEKLLQATGNSLYSTIAQVVGAVTNLILDPILIYGLLGAPKCGVQGAAFATVIGQIASMAVAMGFHFIKNKEVENGITYLRPSGPLLKEIYAIGLPAIIAQAVMSVMTYGMNLILVRLGENVVTAFGVYYKVQQFILFAAFGLRDAITPILSFNHGLGSKKRVRDGVKYAQIDTLIIMTAGVVLIEIFARPFSSLFGLSGATLDLCVGAMRIITLSFFFAGANVAFQGIFQALNAGFASLVISVCRQLAFVLPVAWGFSFIAASHPGMTWVVWLTFLIAEGLSLIIAVLFYRRVDKKTIAPLAGE